MIKLKNIVMENNAVKSEIVPEDSKMSGTIEINLLENKIVNFALPIGYEWCKNHLYHAKRVLIELSRTKTEIPKEKLIMWY